MQGSCSGERGSREQQIATERMLKLEGPSGAFWSNPFRIQVMKLPGGPQAPNIKLELSITP